MSGYSTREVADLLGMKPDQVRHYVRRDLCTPHRGDRGEYRFTFQDVVLLRTAKSLLDADVTTRRAYRVLLKLKNELSHAGPLSSMRIFADGNNVVVRDDNRVWDVETGQGKFMFKPMLLMKAVFNLQEERSWTPFWKRSWRSVRN